MGTELTQNIDKNLSGGEGHEHGVESRDKYGEMTWRLCRTLACRAKWHDVNGDRLCLWRCRSKSSEVQGLVMGRSWGAAECQHPS